MNKEVSRRLHWCHKAMVWREWELNYRKKLRIIFKFMWLSPSALLTGSWEVCWRRQCCWESKCSSEGSARTFPTTYYRRWMGSDKGWNTKKWHYPYRAMWDEQNWSKRALGFRGCKHRDRLSSWENGEHREDVPKKIKQWRWELYTMAYVRPGKDAIPNTVCDFHPCLFGTQSQTICKII